MAINTEVAAPPLHGEIIMSPDEVKLAVVGMAEDIIEKFQGKNPLFVCLMRGGVYFATELMKAIVEKDLYFNPQLDYMTVSTYGDGQKAGEPRIVMDLGPDIDLTNRPVIVLDDLIDNGNTYTHTRQHLQSRGVDEENIYLAVLAQRVRKDRDIHADFAGIQVESQEWLAGAGMNDNRHGDEALRWFGGIAIAIKPGELQ
ncbi:MAG: hypothetical protein JWL85_558 [Candidatus Saccharibacteria bacterium]|nr:hypothetical protein [Candidatus Saccharibacteria bacterium]